jgi:hypothetical protein
VQNFGAAFTSGDMPPGGFPRGHVPNPTPFWKPKQRIYLTMDKHADLIKQAETVHTHMVARLNRAREDLAANEARRHELALAAETGDAEAKREGAPLAKVAASLRDAIEHSLTPAVAQAAQRVTAARMNADAETKRQVAIKVREISARLATRGAALDAALNQARQGYHAFQDDLRELALLGAPSPSANLVEVDA